MSSFLTVYLLFFNDIALVFHQNEGGIDMCHQRIQAKKGDDFPENFSPLVTSALIVIADLSEPWLTRHISNYFNWSRVLGEVVIK